MVSPGQHTLHGVNRLFLCSFTFGSDLITCWCNHSWCYCIRRKRFLWLSHKSPSRKLRMVILWVHREWGTYKCEGNVTHDKVRFHNLQKVIYRVLSCGSPSNHPPTYPLHLWSVLLKTELKGRTTQFTQSKQTAILKIKARSHLLTKNWNCSCRKPLLTQSLGQKKNDTQKQSAERGKKVTAPTVQSHNVQDLFNRNEFV